MLGFASISVTLILITLAPCMVESAGFGPSYPITAAWFKDRFTTADWNKTLTDYAAIGGDTLLFRAPSINIATRDEVASDPEFKWCGSYRSDSDDGTFCLDEITEELSAHDLTVAMFATFKYEEGYNESAIMRCPQYDRRVVTSRVYYLLVLPLSDPVFACNFQGSHVMVLVTSFAGIDPHHVALESAKLHNMSVYFGLPALPVPEDKQPGPVFDPFVPYIEFIRRIVFDHNTRYSNNATNTTLYKTLKGYFYSRDTGFTQLEDNIALFQHLRNLTHSVDKQLGIVSHFDTVKYKPNATLTVDDISEAFESFVNLTDVDVFAIKDGRGSGNGGLFWETQEDSMIRTIDPDLHAVLKYRYPSIGENVTYNDIFTTSISKIFENLASARENLSNMNKPVDLWLTIEAYDYLHDDPCLPVDHAGSGLDQMLNRVTKSRLDYVLTHAGTTVQKVAALAWDPSFTCRTNKMTFPLSSQVKKDKGRPIIAKCFFHSASNRSVVVIGYNLLAETQGFTVSWPNVNGHRETSNDVHGYYFESDWGNEHHRVPSLIYTQLYDPYNVISLAPKGFVRVTVGGGYHSCAFKFDFTDSSLRYRPTDTRKRFYYKVDTPLHRVYGQDTPWRNRGGITWNRNRRILNNRRTLHRLYGKGMPRKGNGTFRMNTERFRN